MGERLTAEHSPRQAGDPAPSRPRTGLRRLTVTYWNENAQVEARHGYGWSWRCTCGEHGERRESRAQAVAEKREHEAGHRAP